MKSEALRAGSLVRVANLPPPPKPAALPLAFEAFEGGAIEYDLVEKITADGVSKFGVGAAIAQFVKEQNP